MGAIRGGGLVIVSVLFLLVLFACGITLALSNSLQYDNVRSGAVGVVNNLLGETNFSNGINSNMGKMSSLCVNYSEYVFKEPNTNEVMVIPCSVVNSGNEAVMNYTINSFVETVYYKEYNCDFWKCLSESGTPLVFISEKAQNYWGKIFYFLLIISVVLFILMLLIGEKRSNVFILGGGLVILSTLPLLKLEIVFNWVFGKLLFGVFKSFFSSAGSTFWIFFGVGIIMIAIGVVIKIFGVGFEISSFFNKFSKSADKSAAAVKETKTVQ